LGLEAVYTGGGTDSSALARLSAAVREACLGALRLPDPRLQRYRALADYYFGAGAGDVLLAGKVLVRGRELQDERKRPLAASTPNGNLALPWKEQSGWRFWDATSSPSATSCPRAPCLRPAWWMQTSRSAPGTR